MTHDKTYHHLSLQLICDMDSVMNNDALRVHPGLREQIGAVFQRIKKFNAELIARNEELQRANRITESERDNYIQLFNNSPVGNLILDRSGIILQANQTFQEIVRQRATALVGKPFHRFLNENDEALFLYRFPEFFQNPRKKSETYRLNEDPGEPRFIQVSGYKGWFHSKPGSTVPENNLFLCITDVTKRVQAEKDVRSLKDRFQHLLESAPVGMVIVDYETLTIVDVNAQAMAILGTCKEGLINKRCNDHFCPAVSGSCPIKDKGQTIDRSEREAVDRDGRRIPILKTVIPIDIDENKLLLECFLDLSEQKEAEKQKLKSEKLQAAVEMVGAVCHEMNQPLQAILGYSQLVAQEREENRLIRWSQRINENAIRLGKVTRRLMNITQFETKAYIGGKKIVDIDRSSGYPPREQGNGEDIGSNAF